MLMPLYASQTVPTVPSSSHKPRLNLISTKLASNFLSSTKSITLLQVNKFSSPLANGKRNSTFPTFHPYLSSPALFSLPPPSNPKMLRIPSLLSPSSLYAAYLRHCFAGAGLSSQTLSIDDDTTLHFYAPKTPQPHKPSLLLLHGFGPSAIWQWRRQVQFFYPHFNLYVPDLVFFGASTTNSPERSEVFQAVCVGKLMEKLGVERYDVMGTSYGGFVAYRMAEKWGHRVRKVVIASSGVNMRVSDNKQVLERAKLGKIENLMLPETASEMRKLLRLAVCKRAYMSPDVIPNFFLNDMIHNLYSDNRKEKIELLKGVTLGRDDTPAICPLEQEVLIVWGEEDHIFPLEMATDLKRSLGEKARLEVIKKTSHVPQIENSRLFNDVVIRFLSA